MRFALLSVVLLGFPGISRPVGAQIVRAPVSAGSVVRAATAASSGNVTPSSLKLIESRARKLGDQASGSGTRYFAVTDADLHGKQPEEVLRRLAPGVNPFAEGVRNVQTLVDLRRPLTLRTGGSVAIGAAILQGPLLRGIEVQSNIFTSGIRITKDR